MGNGWRATALVLASLLSLAAACGNGELEGPERFEFDDVSALTLDVERGEVRIFASELVEGGAVVERWSTDRSDFDERREELEDHELVVAASCRDSAQCEVRYDVTVAPRAEITAHVGRGSMRIIKSNGIVDATVNRGDLTARAMTSRHSRLTAGDGKITVIYPEVTPGKLELTLGTDSSATAHVPPGPYRCYFDQNDSNIVMGDLQCKSGVIPAIVIEPRNGSVYFVVSDD